MLPAQNNLVLMVILCRRQRLFLDKTTEVLHGVRCEIKHISCIFQTFSAPVVFVYSWLLTVIQPNTQRCHRPLDKSAYSTGIKVDQHRLQCMCTDISSKWCKQGKWNIKHWSFVTLRLLPGWYGDFTDHIKHTWHSHLNTGTPCV